MPTIIFERQAIDVSTTGYAKIASLCAVTHTPDERRDAILDVLFDEGLLCDVCGAALATRRAQFHEDVRLCGDCATEEPCPENGNTADEPPQDESYPDALPSDPDYNHDLLF